MPAAVGALWLRSTCADAKEMCSVSSWLQGCRGCSGLSITSGLGLSRSHAAHLLPSSLWRSDLHKPHPPHLFLCPALAVLIPFCLPRQEKWHWLYWAAVPELSNCKPATALRLHAPVQPWRTAKLGESLDIVYPPAHTSSTLWYASGLPKMWVFATNMRWEMGLKQNLILALCWGWMGSQHVKVSFFSISTTYSCIHERL